MLHLLCEAYVIVNDILKSFCIALVAGILKSNGIKSRIKMLGTWCLLVGESDFSVLLNAGTALGPFVTEFIILRFHSDN
jgi:hypothetical protein